MPEKTGLIIQQAKELLSTIGFPDAGVTATEGEEGVIEVAIEVPPEQSGFLIGFHGETLASLQLVIGQMVYKRLGEWQRILVNIGDYREKRERSLQEMADNAAQRVKITQQPVTLPYLSSSERRLVHLALADDEEVETSSEGSGRGRRLTIYPKSGHAHESNKDDQATA